MLCRDSVYYFCDNDLNTQSSSHKLEYVKSPPGPSFSSGVCDTPPCILCHVCAYKHVCMYVCIHEACNERSYTVVEITVMHTRLGMIMYTSMI